MSRKHNNHQTKAKILLVEDDLDALKAFARFLQSDGHIVHTAEGYQDAIDVTKKERLDLAICDIGLWDGDGCDLLQELQHVQALKAIAISGFASAEDVERYKDAGFDAVHSKPLAFEQMALTISKLVRASECT